MTKTMVKINWKNTYGRTTGTEIKWYKTEIGALRKAKMLKEKNGGFVEIVKIKNADYDKYMELKRVEKELEKTRKELAKEF